MTRFNRSTKGLRIRARLIGFSRRKTVRASVAALAALAALTLLRAADPWFVAELKERTFDAYQRILPREDADVPVRIVAIDEASVAAFGQWPWPRTRLAALTRRLGELGAAVVAYDIIFAEADRTSPGRLSAELREADVPPRDLALLASLPDHDRLFAEAMDKTVVVLGFATTAAASGARPPVKAAFAYAGAQPGDVIAPFRGAVSNIATLDQAASGVGGIDLSAADRSGIVRRIPMLFFDGDKVYPGLAVEALRVAQRQTSIIVRGTGASGEADSGQMALLGMRVGDVKMPLSAGGEARLYFHHEKPGRSISAKDVLDPAGGSRLKDRIDGSIVLVGPSAAGLADIRTTPLGEVVPGVTIQAQLIEQILSQDFIERPDWANGLEILLTVLFGLLVLVLVLLLGSSLSLYVGLALTAAAVACSWLAFSHLKLLIDPVYPSLAAMATFIAVERVLHRATDREKKFVRHAFSQYLAPELLAQLEKSPDALRLGGEARDITVMFMDVRSFTPISEALNATELVGFINTLLAPLSNEIQHELGTIDKYIGDSIMAFWNAPVDVDGHAARACRAALKMRSAIAALNARDAFGFRARGLGEVKIGVGVNTGIACVGNMGSQRRFNYSAMGDVVNVAARIESATKNFGVDLLVSDDVAARAGGIPLLEAGEILLKGKSRPTRVHAVAGDEAMASSGDFITLSRLHDRLMAAIRSHRAAEAGRLLAACRSRSPEGMAGLYAHLAERIEQLQGRAA